MSVLVLDPKTYESVFEKAVCYTFRKEVNINYCDTLGSKTENQLANVVRLWANLNVKSYDVRYKQEPDKVPYSTFLRLNFNTMKCKRIDTYQMLKTLQCIYYNIEVETIEEVRPLTIHEKQAVTLLKAAIDEIQGIIINELPEYKAAKWGDF